MLHVEIMKTDPVVLGVLESGFQSVLVISDRMYVFCVIAMSCLPSGASSCDESVG